MKKSAGAPYILSRAVAKKIPWFQERLLNWYVENARKFPWRDPGNTPYQLLLAEVLLQRTTARAVASYLPVFIEKYPTWLDLSSANPGELESILVPLGLWKQKAGVLRALANSIINRDGNIPCSRDELEQLPGVGQYIAGAALLLLCGIAAPLLDTTMARVLERFFGPRQLVDIRYDPYLQELANQVVQHEYSLTLNWAILDHGALVCLRKRPLCSDCPLREHCRYASLTPIST